ncbi:MAG: aldo/keto reductase [Phycisphaerae bacterium]|nr:aldo/keto reductase [Phycisphaerae bacterium]
MRTRKLGKTDLNLTTVGLGTWAIGGPWEYGWGPQNDADSVAAIRTALESGINWIDTAPAYGCGHGEEVVGKVLREVGEMPIVATKCGILWNEKREKMTCLKAKSVRAECDASLRRLGVDVIDLYQMHWPDPDADVEEGWEAMVRLREAGKVRHIGASNFSLRHLERVERIERPVSLQPPYSMIKRDAEAVLLPYCREHEMGVVAYSPMQKGLLTGKYTPEKVAELAPDDHRRRDPDFVGRRLEANMELAKGIADLARGYGRTAGQFAVAWVLRNDEVTAAIVGARNRRQIEETVQAGDWALDEEALARADELLERHKGQIENA